MAHFRPLTTYAHLCIVVLVRIPLGPLLRAEPRAPRSQPVSHCAGQLLHQQVRSAADAEAGWVFVVDNLNVHCSEMLVRYVARLDGIDESTLGRKGKSGVLLIPA